MQVVRPQHKIRSQNLTMRTEADHLGLQPDLRLLWCNDDREKSIIQSENLRRD